VLKAPKREGLFATERRFRALRLGEREAQRAERRAEEYDGRGSCGGEGPPVSCGRGDGEPK
jgi:hypothetical protein